MKRLISALCALLLCISVCFAVSAETADDGQGGLALGLSIAALVVAAGGALLGGFALGRRKTGA